MLRSFHLSTPKSPKGILYHYDVKTELFVGLKIKEMELCEKSTEYIISSIKLKQSDFFEWAKQLKGATLVETTQVPEFETFWRKYAPPANSSKKKALAVWNRMTDDNKNLAYLFIKIYEKNRGDTAKKYAETYLNSELWNN